MRFTLPGPNFVLLIEVSLRSFCKTFQNPTSAELTVSYMLPIHDRYFIVFNISLETYIVML